jgi:hypothetical protein
MYHDEEEKYNYSDFPQLKIFIDHTFDLLHIVLWNNPVVGVQQTTFFYYGKLYNIHKTCKLTSLHIMVTQETWAQSMHKVKT